MKTPALVHLGTNSVVEFQSKTVVVVGRSREADLPIYDPACSRRQFLIRRMGDQYLLEPLSENSPTFCDGVRATTATPVREGTRIEAGASQFKLVGTTQAAPPKPPASQAHQATVIGTRSTDDPSLDVPAITIQNDVILGRDATVTTQVLAHPLVSRRHALIRQTPSGAVVKDLQSANGTYVNGKRIGVAVSLRIGDRVQIGPFAFQFTGTALAPASSAAGAFAKYPLADVRLAAHGLGVTVDTNRLLHEVSLAVRGGEFVAVLGPSGSGKSTLLKALSGAYPPTDGSVIFDGCNLYAAPAGATRRVAVVPQREILPTGLTVAEALRYTAALRLPPDTSSSDLEERVTASLGLVGLKDRRTAKIATLSGGQLKRVGLANELLADPGLILLDEVTSGLDEQADREMMALFRQLANGGRAVVAVTHTLAHVVEYCHRVVVLTSGGRVAFIGPPAETLSYFGIDRLGDVYEQLAERTPELWAKQWENADRQQLPPAPPVPANATVQERVDTWAAIKHQTPILAKRTARVLVADQAALLASVAQPLLIGLLLVWVFGDVRNPTNPTATANSVRSILFVLSVTAFWLGCNTAAKEIIREWDLHHKERQSHLSPAAYLLAKWGVLAIVTVGQILLLFSLVAWGCHLSGHLLTMGILLSLVGLAGVSAGLLASACATTEAVAVALVPVLVIPQIVLTDVFNPLSGTAKTFANVTISSHRSFNGLLSALQPDLAAIVAPSGATPIVSAIWLVIQAVAIAVLAWHVLDLRGRPTSLQLSATLSKLTRGAK